MSNRSRDWFRQAGFDLEKARLDRDSGFNEWSCFIAHQSADKAVKSVFYARNAEARGHGVRELLLKLDVSENDKILTQAAFLDKYYIPTRYPNGLPEGAPHDSFTENEASMAIAAAEVILAWSESKLSAD